MQIDWNVVATIASPIIALFVGMLINRAIERKPRLIAYFTHASAFPLQTPTPLTINTHGIVIRNVGKRSATDVRVRHHVLPQNFIVYPPVEHRVENIQGGGVEIIFPTLVPNEQVSISYLYFPPLIYNQIHAGIRHRDGFATEVTVLPTSQHPAWVSKSLWLLLLLGLITFMYLIFKSSSYAYYFFTHLQ
jgi:hypothetical protein